MDVPREGRTGYLGGGRRRLAAIREFAARRFINNVNDTNKCAQKNRRGVRSSRVTSDQTTSGRREIVSRP